MPGVERQPLKKLAVDESVLLKLLHRWREEAEKAGYMIKRIAVAFEAEWFPVRTENARDTRKTMIVALARKLLIALWRLVRGAWCQTGVILRPAQ